MRFQAPQLGAMGATFSVMRACQFASLIAVIGLCANFINGIATAEHSPPAELIGTLTVAVTAVIYVVITYILYYDNMLPLLATGILDSLLLIASIVVASLIGKPLSGLNCAGLPASSSLTATTFFVSTSSPIRASVITKTLSYFTFVTLDQPTCYEIKAVWGLSIALCAVFAFSALVCIGLWYRIRRDAAPAGNPKEDMETAATTAPYFPPPPLAPIRDRGRDRGRARLPPPINNNPRRVAVASPPSRLSNDSSTSTYNPEREEAGSPPQPHGLRPPPPVHTQPARIFTGVSSLTARQEDDDTDEDGISPLLSPDNDDDDDVIPPEHKRIPIPIPRSPLSPLRNLGLGVGLGLGFMSSSSSSRRRARVGGIRKAVPPPIVVVHPPPPRASWEQNMNKNKKKKGVVVGEEMKSPEVVSARGVIVDADAAITTSPGLAAPAPANTAAGGKKRRTVWGLIDGWWDLGLLERMGTVRRKR
ncbi:hypothetical protein C8A00DRAFT_38513 [Chaetomidium leptoderma]|uniref:MARVEL domain-containing protein n=1 Tax=Chaetomidium leptoderma TaxID=669021 RepID=A0AAN6VDJ1_9PEZI|nr:hypothetical protein C8A00DRAFT_38513 [Chaetomidium leptoderma]